MEDRPTGGDGRSGSSEAFAATGGAPLTVMRPSAKILVEPVAPAIAAKYHLRPGPRPEADDGILTRRSAPLLECDGDAARHATTSRGRTRVRACGHRVRVRRGSAIHLPGPYCKVTVGQQIAEGDLVVTRVTARGTHMGTCGGIPPTNKQMVIEGVNIDRVTGGMIVEHWGAANTFESLVAIGALPLRC